MCPSEIGAFKRTVAGDWCHMLCALWVPGLRIMDHKTMEPVDGFEDVPEAVLNHTCSVCNAKMGACLTCSSDEGCATVFHATCAQQNGLLVELSEASRTEVRLVGGKGFIALFFWFFFNINYYYFPSLFFSYY